MNQTHRNLLIRSTALVAIAVMVAIVQAALKSPSSPLPASGCRLIPGSHTFISFSNPAIRPSNVTKILKQEPVTLQFCVLPQTNAGVLISGKLTKLNPVEASMIANKVTKTLSGESRIITIP